MWVARWVDWNLKDRVCWLFDPASTIFCSLPWPNQGIFDRANARQQNRIRLGVRWRTLAWGWMWRGPVEWEEDGSTVPISGGVQQFSSSAIQRFSRMAPKWNTPSPERKIGPAGTLIMSGYVPLSVYEDSGGYLSHIRGFGILVLVRADTSRVLSGYGVLRCEWDRNSARSVCVSSNQTTRL